MYIKKMVEGLKLFVFVIIRIVKAYISHIYTRDAKSLSNHKVVCMDRIKYLSMQLQAF